MAGEIHRCAHFNYNLTVCGQNIKSCFKGVGTTFIPSVSNKDLLTILRKAKIFIFPSDRSKGWRVVLGEALSCGCICFPNINAGSTRYLIKDYKKVLRLGTKWT